MKITWRSPSNIALIKYWGKHGIQLPNNPSLSLTLSEAYTDTSVELKKKRSKKEIEIDFLFEGEKKPPFEEKLLAFLSTIKNDVSFIKNYRLIIRSENSFPHSAGIASSASSMGALALCLLSQQFLTGKQINGDFFQTASNYARLGSGSAARSIYGGFTVWGKTDSIKNSNDNYAIQYPIEYHKDFTDLQDTILIINSDEKNVSSRAGHALMNNHPMEKQRYVNANKRLQDILLALKKGDWNLFCETVEAEALELHALMMTSTPSFILMKPNTLAVIEKIRQFRIETKIPVCFTLDAGPNVHVIYPYFEKKKVRNFIQSELLQYCVKKKVIYDVMGNGPKQIVED
ncbi:MAG: diphosphomevalonate decarboxylase [Fimbriimonadaceae bacterium]|nr:diphosphomevalonate decarboxylase [Chitinophagales bacterium]